MAETIQRTYRGLLARIALWSLVSLPSYWIPLLSMFHYGETRILTPIICCFGVPFLGVAAVMSVRSIAGVRKALQPYPKGRRWALGFVALTLSAPTVVAAGTIVSVFVLILAHEIYRALCEIVLW